MKPMLLLSRLTGICHQTGKNEAGILS